jgi:hypothetical protein
VVFGQPNIRLDTDVLTAAVGCRTAPVGRAVVQRLDFDFRGRAQLSGDTKNMTTLKSDKLPTATVGVSSGSMCSVACLEHTCNPVC